MARHPGEQRLTLADAYLRGNPRVHRRNKGSGCRATPDLIDKATRNDLREVLVGFVLRDIDMDFEAVGRSRKMDYTRQGGSERCSLIEQFYANIAFCSTSDVQKILAGYEEVLLRLECSSGSWPEAKQTIKDFLRRVERDG